MDGEKFFKTGESRKLSPRRTGPWTVIEKLLNGVNFRVCCDRTKEEKIVHHDRLYPVKKGTEEMNPIRSYVQRSDTDNCSSKGSDDGSDYVLSLSDFSSEEEQPRLPSVLGVILREQEHSERFQVRCHGTRWNSSGGLSSVDLLGDWIVCDCVFAGTPFLYWMGKM